ncbi:MAG: phosphatidylserine decarboxylase family protein [Verrucomicrobia bacterium]|nr:phosphatidylserine decarboxylase family protein [Verrucomicrobiota bacterium]
MKKPARALFEGRWIFLTLGIVWIVSFQLHLHLGMAFAAAMIVFSLWFFRDPERVSPADPLLAVSPADGTVTLVEEVEEDQFFKRRMKRVSIFLSVFDVHVNRTPIAGEVLFTEGRGGLYLDARKPEASVLNESLYWVFGSKERMEQAVGVKQITGAIARRIVPWAKVGETLVRGERFGMIRFGSRTDLYLPLDSEVLVAVGQKVKGGETPVARMSS